MTIARVYEYGLGDPTVNAPLVVEQMRAAHRYRNTLVEIERDRRAAVRAILAGHPDAEPIAAELNEVRQKRDELRQQIKLTRSADRARSETSDQRRAVRDLNHRIKELAHLLKQAKAVVANDPAIQTALKRAEERARQRVRDERERCSVYWGTYLIQEAAVDQARKSKTDPHFLPWTGEGRVSVQLQGGLALDEVWGGDTQLQIRKPDAIAWDEHAARGDRRMANRTTLSMRVQSDPKGKPVWAEWPLVMHRPLPEGCRIKVATVHRRRRDVRRWDWRLTLQVELPDAWTRGTAGVGAVALNLGFCQTYPHLEGGIRAGFLVDEHGNEREVAVDKSVIERIEKAESIRSIRDKNLDQMRPALWAWVGKRGDLPPWWTQGQYHTLYAWNSPQRFVQLSRRWDKNRWVGDSAGWEILERWRYRDEHLQRYEAGLMRGAQLDRREVYRKLAAELAQRYRTLVIHDTDLRDFQRSPLPEEERVEWDVAKRNQRHACGSLLRGVMANAFTRVGGEVVELPAENNTRKCHVCGSIEQWDQAREREHTCGACGAVWDQDVNHCKNLLARYREHLRSPPGSEGARGATPPERKESRSERLRRTRHKPKDVGGARDTEPNVP